MSSIPEFAVCREKPTITEMSGFYVVVYRRDPDLTTLFADENKKICELLAGRPPAPDPSTYIIEWKLPLDAESRLIEYFGKPVKYSKTRFGMLKALILARGEPVTYSDIALAGWGEPTDRDVIEATVYQFNKFLAASGIPKFISCSKERVFFSRLGVTEEPSENSLG